jgi:4'-phosphopantetheinyl transferase
MTESISPEASPLGQRAGATNRPSILANGWRDAEPEFIAHTESLEEKDVHLWAWEINASREQREHLLGLLSEDERHHHARFQFERDRHAFLIARGHLRRILGAYLSLPPAGVAFDYTQYGRPCIAARESPLNPAEFEFNLSHTRTLAVAAVARSLKVGVDIEEIRPIELSIAQHVFSAGEQQALRSLNPEQFLAGFYRCWTRKEAVSKAEGLGLNMEFSRFSVSLGASDPPRIEDAGDVLSHTWLLQDVPAIDGAIGALATSELPSRVMRFRLPAEGRL